MFTRRAHRRLVECIGALGICGMFSGAALHAGERIVLNTGFEIHADWHEVNGDAVLVHDGSGVTQLPVSSIREYKVEEYLEPTPAPIVPQPTPVAASPAVGGGSVDPKQLVRDVIAKQNLPPEMVALVNSVMKQESGFHAGAVSPKGAIGLMQLMPGTARDLGANPQDPAQNVDAGTRYLTALLKKYEGRDDQVIRALAAYNAGPGAVDKYNGVPPYRETRDYVRKIVKNYQAQTAQTGE